MDAIAVSNLSFAYPNQDPVLKAVDLTICEGDRVGLIGHNGCGKTTLFLLVCGVLTPQSGEIFVYEKLVQPGAFRPDIGLVLQNPNDQLFCMSVWDDIAFAPQNLGLSADEIDRRVAAAMRCTGVESLAQRPPHHLSGGEKRMVAIAGILAMQPQVILYDEPSANLDLRARRRLIEFLKTAPQTTVITSHDFEFLLEVCDRIILMSNGQAIADGTPTEIMGDRALMAAYELEVPASIEPK